MDPAAETERIVDEGQDVRERVRRLTRDTLARGMGSAEQGARDLGSLAERMFNAAAEAVNRKPDDQAARTAMNDVVDGFTAGLNEAADATRDTIDRASERGQKFAKEDLKRSVDDLESVRKSLIDAVTNVATSVKGIVSEEATAMKDRAKRATDSARPKVEQAAKAAREHPGEVATGAMASAMHAGAAAVSVFGEAVSGALSGLGDALGERAKPADKPTEPTPPSA